MNVERGYKMREFEPPAGTKSVTVVHCWFGLEFLHASEMEIGEVQNVHPISGRSLQNH